MIKIDIIQLIITVLCSILASSGLWAFIMKKIDSKDVKTKMIIGLGHDRIMHLGMNYIQRGWITDDEYENLYDYLYVPYEQIGGNGSAKRVMEEVKKLEIRRTPPGSYIKNAYGSGKVFIKEVDE